MNSICITGYLPVDLSLVESILNQAGMQHALPAQRDSSMTIDVWHQRVAPLLVSMDNRDTGDEFQTTNLGRLWEQLASDIFISNLQSSVWGWADTRSSSLLPFWKNFDPQLRFVLVICSSERLIAHAIELSDEVPDLEKILTQWQSHYRVLHEFHQANPRCSILVNIQDCISHPAAFLQSLNKAWGLKLNKVHYPNIGDAHFSELSRYLASGLLQAFTTESVPNEKINEILKLNSSGIGNESVPSYKELIRWLRKVRAEQAKFVQLQNDSQEKHKELVEKLSQEKATIDELSDTNYDLDKLQRTQAAEIEQLRADILRLESAPVNSYSPPRIYKYSESQGDYQKDLLENSTASADDYSQKLKQANESLKATVARENDLKEENDLLLLQLHQVQEELEVYFLKYQEASKKVDSADARWQRMLTRNTDYCDVESIEVQVVINDKTQRLNWTLKGLDAVGRHIPEISFSTFIEQGIACFEFSRIDQGNAGLLRWPAALSDENSLIIAMGGDDKSAEKRALAIIGLSTSDWTLLNVLIKLLHKELVNPILLRVPTSIDSAMLIDGLEQLEGYLKSIPDILRYDAVKLKREQVNPDYEHLWFSFENMKSASSVIGDFEFRISCANVRPKKFGDHPKLEFPEDSCQAAMQSWFAESYDDYGAKLELRFALPEALDMEVWGKLNAQDQLFIKELVRQLPEVMQELRLTNNTPKRDWDDWITMASEMQRILTTRAEPQMVAPSKRKSTPRKSASASRH